MGCALTLLVVAIGSLAGVLAPFDPFALVGPPLAAPSRAFPMGTDGLGRDVLSGVIYGARTSLLIAVSVGLLALAIGVLVGALAGYRGGGLDDLLMRVTEVFQVLPRFFLAIVVISLFGAGLDRLILVLGLTSWPLLARVVRAEILAFKQLEFVEAAVASGASNMRLLIRELLPNALPPVIVYVALLLAQVMLLEASLGFLGLGDPDVMSWGYLAAQAQQFLRVGWWMWFFPGVALIVAVLGFNLLGDALTDSLGGRR